jgi:DNA-binding XRE family transcriptional regulator
MLKDLMDELQLIKKMSVTSICLKMGISRQTYYHWIDGNHCPTFKNIISLAECFTDDISEQQKIAEKIQMAVFQTQLKRMINNGK